jgi:hypothetical protein
MQHTAFVEKDAPFILNADGRIALVRFFGVDITYFTNQLAGPGPQERQNQR